MEIMRPRGPFEYLGILWRKKLLIFLVAASVSIATLQIVRRIPNIYESHASIAILNQGAGNEGSPSTISLSTLTQQMTSQGKLTEVVRQQNLYPRARGEPSDPGAAVERLRKAIKIDVKMRNYYPDAPESLTVSYRYTDANIAQSVIKDLISIFEKTNAATQ